jgi:hypothetical protein
MASASYGLVRQPVTDQPGPAKPPENRKVGGWRTIAWGVCCWRSQYRDTVVGFGGLSSTPAALTRRSSPPGMLYALGSYAWRTRWAPMVLIPCHPRLSGPDSANEQGGTRDRRQRGRRAITLLGRFAWSIAGLAIPTRGRAGSSGRVSRRRSAAPCPWRRCRRCGSGTPATPWRRRHLGAVRCRSRSGAGRRAPP